MITIIIVLASILVYIKVTEEEPNCPDCNKCITDIYKTVSIVPDNYPSLILKLYNNNGSVRFTDQNVANNIKLELQDPITLEDNGDINELENPYILDSVGNYLGIDQPFLNAADAELLFGNVKIKARAELVHTSGIKIYVKNNDVKYYLKPADFNRDDVQNVIDIGSAVSTQSKVLSFL